MWLIWKIAGQCIMGNTSAVDQGQILQEECHGPENLVMKKLSLLFHLASLMALNGSESKYIHQ